MESMAPIINPMKTFGVNTSTVLMLALLTKAPNKVRDTRVADPIAKP
jgi:hypothetical protein